MTFRPDQRNIECQVMTTTGWLRGTFHVPQSGAFLDQLNLRKPFFGMTDVTFPGRDVVLSFLALRRQSVVLVVPPVTAKHLSRESGEDLRVKRVSCLFDGGIAVGNLWIDPQLRVSDFLAKQTGYFLLRRTRLLLGRFQDDFWVEEEHAVTAVNSSAIIGVTESDLA